jgi:hypothetical protein
MNLRFIHRAIKTLKKYICVFAVFIFASVIAVFIPIFLLLNVNSVMYLINWGKSDTIALLTSAILPFLFTVICAIFGYMVKLIIDIRDKTVIEVNNINEIIKTYNLFILRLLKRNGVLTKNVENLLPMKERFKTFPQLKCIVQEWERKSCEIISPSYNDEFRSFIRDHVSRFLQEPIEDASIFLYLGNMAIIQEEMEIFNNNDSIFLFKMRKLLNLDEEEKGIFTFFCDTLGVGNVFYTALERYNLIIKKYNNISSQDKNNYAIHYDCITGIIEEYFNLLETVTYETFIIYEFLKKIINKFKIYYKNSLEEYKIIDNLIEPYEISHKQEIFIEKIMKYINKQKLYESYGININDKKRK